MEGNYEYRVKFLVIKWQLPKNTHFNLINEEPFMKLIISRRLTRGNGDHGCRRRERSIHKNHKRL